MGKLDILLRRREWLKTTQSDIGSASPHTHSLTRSAPDGTSDWPDRCVVDSKVVRKMNSIIYVVGLVVVVGFILNFVVH